MLTLNRALTHSAELTKMLSHALEIHTPDSVEEARVGKLIATMQAQATQIEEQLQRLCSEYAVEVNTTKLRLWERKLLDLTLRNNLLIQQIATQLEKLGYEVHTAVGASDFKIDIAVVDPAHPDKYLLGIICDGEGYYRLKTVVTVRWCNSQCCVCWDGT